MKNADIRKVSLILLSLFLIGAGAWGLGGVLSRPTPPSPDAPPTRRTAGTPTAPPTEPPTASSDAGLRGTRDATAAPPAPSAPFPPSAPIQPSTAFVPTPVDMAAFAAAQPAQVRSPFGLSPRRGHGAQMGPTGGGGPTGHWMRFSGLSPHAGKAGVEVAVLDENGRAIEGATVYLAPPTTLEVEALSFGDLRVLGTTDARGRVQASDLPAGAGVICANAYSRLNTRRGLDVRHAVPALLADGETFRALVTLPIDSAAFGTITGRVVDEKGTPIPSATIATATRRVWSNAEGRFRLEGAAAGTNALSIGATGRQTEGVEVDVPEGGHREVLVELAFADRGSLRLEGRAQLPGGAPVANARVYLVEIGARGTLRSSVTDATGAFLLEDLPDRLRDHGVKVQVIGFPQYRTGMLELAEGLKDERVVVEVPGAFTQIRLRLLDAGSGEALRVAHVEYVEEGKEGQRPNTLSFDREGDVWRSFIEGRRGTLTVDTLTHGGWSDVIDLPAEGGILALEIRLVRQHADPVLVALDLHLLSAGDGAPVTQAKIEILDATSSTAISRFEGTREDGLYRLPAPSGSRRIVITAPGFEKHEEVIEFAPDLSEVAVEIRLRPER